MRVMMMIAVVVLASGIATPHNRTANNLTNQTVIDDISRGYISHRGSLNDRFEVAQAVSNRCLTPYFWCLLPGYFPVNSPCWCATPNGPVPGVVG